jgi:hypothetical protein
MTTADGGCFSWLEGGAMQKLIMYRDSWFACSVLNSYLVQLIFGFWKR